MMKHKWVALEDRRFARKCECCGLRKYAVIKNNFLGWDYQRDSMMQYYYANLRSPEIEEIENSC